MMTTTVTMASMITITIMMVMVVVVVAVVAVTTTTTIMVMMTVVLMKKKLTLLMTGLCEDSVVIDGIGYRAHPYEADKYIQCYFPSQGLAVSVVRECPFGLLWNPHARLCDTYLRVRLAHGKAQLAHTQRRRLRTVNRHSSANRKGVRGGLQQRVNVERKG